MKFVLAAFEWKVEDLWVGVYWRRVGPMLHVWVCFLPCVPLHLVFERRDASAFSIVPPRSPEPRQIYGRAGEAIDAGALVVMRGDGVVSPAEAADLGVRLRDAALASPCRMVEAWVDGASPEAVIQVAPVQHPTAPRARNGALRWVYVQHPGLPGELLLCAPDPGK